MIGKEDTLNKILTEYPILIPMLESNGFKGLDNKYIVKQIGNMTIESLLINKELNVDLFLDMLNEYLAQNEHNVLDSNLKPIKVVGLLPCPVRLPLIEKFSELTCINEIDYQLKAASDGLDWLKDEVVQAKTEDDLADIYISAGFDLFFEEQLMKHFKDEGVFENFYDDVEYNSDFNNEFISLKDPNKDYSMIGVVPAVFLVNTMILGDRKMPKTWSDLLDPSFENSVSLPVSDFDLFNAILIHLYKEFGEEGITKLSKSLVKSMHPAEMLKSDRKNRVKPAVSIMPYFFTKMALPGSVMEAVWPEDGAIVSPIFMLTKKSKKESILEISDLLASKEVGSILSHQGLFPSVHKDVDNSLDHAPYKWIGWDYIENNNIGEILEKCLMLFEKGMK